MLVDSWLEWHRYNGSLDFAIGKVTAPAGRESFLVETRSHLSIGVMRRQFADTRNDGGGCQARIGGPVAGVEPRVR